MGVAMLNVPLGTYVEISYGGRSVIAVVNDPVARMSMAA